MKPPNCSRMLILKALSLSLLLLYTHFSTAQESLAAVVASISFARGSNAAVMANQPPRMLGKGTPIYEGDNIQTSERSFVIITFNDGAKITVRPNSSFSVTEYQNTEKNQQAKLTLHKGGVRASTGKIAQQDPDKYQIKTALATIKAQQADYSVRICQQDCEQETQQYQHKTIKKTQNVIARIVTIKGTVTAKNKQQSNKQNQQRHLAKGAPLYTADSVNSQNNSHALLAFRDGGKMTLQANSEFDISNYHYQQEDTQDQALFNLVKGGLRALTGRIGKVEKEDYQINTPVATIGIRGTGFDLHCKGDCEDENASGRPTKNPPAKIKQGQAEGLYSSVWQGSISQTNTKGRFELSKPNVNYIANKKTKPQALKQLPDDMRNNPAPRPDKVETNEESLFGSAALQGTPWGVYVSVHNGHVQLINDQTGQQQTIKADQSIEPETTTEQADIERTADKQTNATADTQKSNKIRQAPLTEKNILPLDLDESEERYNDVKHSNKPETTTEQTDIEITTDNEVEGKTLQTASTENKNDSLDLGKNEVGYIDANGELVRLDRQQSFQLEDDYPLPSDFNEEYADIGVYSLLADNYDMQEFTIYECISD